MNKGTGRIEDSMLQECPYNMSHQIRASKFLNHLLKCRRAYVTKIEVSGEEVMFLTCKYNWAHRVPAPEIIHHENNCSDRKTVTRYVIEIVSPDPLDASKDIRQYNYYATFGVPHPHVVYNCGSSNKKQEEPLLVKPATFGIIDGNYQPDDSIQLPQMILPSEPLQIKGKNVKYSVKIHEMNNI